MISKSKLLVLFFSALVVVYGLVGGMLERVSAGDDPYGPLAIFTDVVQKVQSDYADEPDMQEAFNGALQGMMEALDPFSSFVDRTTYQELKEQHSLTGSPGMIVSKRYGYAYVVSVIPGSPAAREGIRTGDLIESVGGKPTIRMSLWEVEARLAGSEGGRVKMRVVRARRTEPTEMELDCEEVKLPRASARLAEEGIGLLEIPNFAQGTAAEIERRVKMLAASGMKGLVIDVRGNARGELKEAVQAADVFLPKGKTIVSVAGRDVPPRVSLSLSDRQVEPQALVLLVDGGTSGVAEVFAAALEDNLDATVLGDRTNGFGSLQAHYPLTDGSALFVTTELYLRSNGAAIQGPTLRESGLRPEVRSPSQDFVTNFYFENTTEDLEESLNDDFYRKLDEAIAREQLESALSLLRTSVLKKAA